MQFNFVVVTFIFICFDIITGLAGSWITGTYKSSIMREGGKHKLMLLVAVVFGLILDYTQTMVDFGFAVQATKLICTYISIMEITSCLENINKTFPGALPDALVNILYNANKQNKNEEGEDENE